MNGTEETEAKIIRAGWMKKKGNKGNLWGDRYFTLRGPVLSYYLKQVDVEPKGIFVLTHSCKVSEIRTNVSKKQKQFLFRVVWFVEDELDEGKKKAEKTASWYGYVSSVLSSSSSHTIPFDQSDPNNSREKNVVFACDRYIDAEKWVNAILMQIHIAQPSNSTTNLPFCKPVYAPPPDVRLTDVEEWVKSAKWKVCSVENGIRIFEIAPAGAPRNELFSLLPTKRTPPCLRISVPLGRSASDVFSTVMSYPSGCLTGVLKGISVVESIDNATDIIHITLDPIYLTPTWTAPRDFCLLRYWRQNTDGSHVVCLDSTVHTDCPLVAGNIRGELHAAYIISPPKDIAGSVDDESTECMLTFIAQLDPKGWIVSEFEYPRAMLQALMLHVLDIRDTLDGDRFVQAQFDPANDERKAIVKGSGSDEPKGTIATTPSPALPPEMWSESDGTAFRVRGATYNIDKVKCNSAPNLFKLLAIDLFEAPELATLNVGANPKNRVALAAQRGDPTWVFIVNVMVPGPPFLSFVAYFEGDPALFEQDTPFGRIAKRFFLGSESENEFRNNRFKLIPRVLDGNILIKMAVKDTPAVIGTKLKQHYFKGDNYFEIDIDVGSSSIARNVCGLAIGYSKTIVVDLGMCLQGDEEDELPEVLLGGFTSVHVDCSKSKPLP